MGYKKKESESSEKLFSKALSMLLSSPILENFEMWDAKERRMIEMREKEARMPEVLSGFEDIVFWANYFL
jgi:hypothetical protein